MNWPGFWLAICLTVTLLCVGALLSWAWRG